MKGQVLSLDLINSVIGFVLIVGLIILILNNSNLRSIFEYELFKMNFIEANRIMFSQIGILDEKGHMADMNTILLRKIRVENILNGSINIDLYINGIIIGAESCRNSSIKLSSKRYLIYNNTIREVELVGCK